MTIKRARLDDLLNSWTERDISSAYTKTGPTKGKFISREPPQAVDGGGKTFISRPTERINVMQSDREIRLGFRSRLSESLLLVKIESQKRSLRKLIWIGGAIFFVLAAIAAIPFLATTEFARYALATLYPSNTPTVGSVILRPSGSVAVRDFVLHDTGALSAQPLITVGAIDATFGWRDLLAGRKLRRIRVADVRIYARSNASSQLSLLDLFFGRTNKPNRATLPIWADEIDVDGIIHREPFEGLAAGTAEWPLKFQIAMSGDRTNPSRRITLSVGSGEHTTDFGVSAVAETNPTGGGTRVVIRSLTTRHGSLAIEPDALREFVAKLPREMNGRIDASIASLSASGELNILDSSAAPTPGPRLSATLAFTGGRVRAPGKSHSVLSLDDLSGAIKVDTPIPLGAATSITIDRLKLVNAGGALDADIVRGYTSKVPVDLHGLIETKIGSLSVSGRVKNVGAKAGMGFSGDIDLQDLSVHSPPGAQHAITLEGLNLAGKVETPLDWRALAAVKVHDGMTRWATLSYGDNAVMNFDASWRIDNHRLSTDHVAAQIFDGTITGAPSLDLLTVAIDHCDLELKSIDVHKALANVSPEHLDAVASASGSIHLAMSPARDLSGNVDLAFDGPGTLRIGQIDEVKQMLVGNFGLDMANLAMHDLEHYPFREGTMHLESAGENSLLKIKFLRQPKSAADVISPHKEIINGREVMVGSLVVPKIDMTIPITGQSLAEILSIVSGVHPMVQAANPTSGR